MKWRNEPPQVELKKKNENSKQINLNFDECLTCIKRPQPAQGGLQFGFVSVADSGLLGGPYGSVLNEIPEFVSSLSPSAQSV